MSESRCFAILLYMNCNPSLLLDGASRVIRRRSKLKPLIFMISSAFLFSGFVSLTPANAWPTSSRVILSGRIQLSAWDINNCVKSLTLSTPDGHVYGAGLGAGCHPTYSFVYDNVPFNGFTVTYVITYKQGGSYSGTFGLSRPLNTYYATINLYQKH